MPGLRPDVDPQGLLEYSVVFSDRGLNHMSQAFQHVMRDISATLTEVYAAQAAVVVPGSGSFGMEAVARQFATDRRCLVIRNGWFSYRWSQIFDRGRIPAESTVLKAHPVADGRQAPYAPPPLGEVVATIAERRPDLVFAPHVETASGMILPDDYLRAVADAVHAVGGLFVLDCVASGAIWVDMKATGVDVLISAPQKGWSASPCCALVMLSERATTLLGMTTSTSYACDLARWKDIMDAYLKGGHAYHATLPTDSLRRLRNTMAEIRRHGFERARAEQWELGNRVRDAARPPRIRERRRPGLRGARRRRELHRRPRPPQRAQVRGSGAADRGRRAAAVRRAVRLPHVPDRPVRPRQAAERRAHGGEPRARARRDRLGTVPGGRGHPPDGYVAATAAGAMPDPVEILRRVFGHPAFRGEQQAIVEHVAAGGDAIVLMPTGGGKSVCYQVPALVRDGVGVVVSPLIALMQDQVDALRELGVAAAFLNSSPGRARPRHESSATSTPGRSSSSTSPPSAS